MEKAHAKAVEAIETFSAQAAAAHATPRFIAKLIENATSSPATLVFGELLDTPAVQNLGWNEDAPNEYRSYLKLLEIFCWGTWEEYHAIPDLPALNEAQSKKLRLLSLISLAREHVPLSYDVAMKALSLDTPSALEALVTEAIYLDLISAKMSPASNPAVIHVTATAPMRDIRPETMTNLLSTLDSWQRRCQSAASDLHKQIEVINRSAEIRHREDNRSDQKIMSPVMYKGKEKDETKREILKPLPQVSSTRANGGRASEAQQERADSAGSQMDIDYDVDLDNLGAPL